MIERKLLKIQKGDVYIQIPPTDLEAIKFTKEVLEFLIERIRCAQLSVEEEKHT